ncbi:unnamed protein product [Polarella glacialis]|uniref:EF-hand domain-containing protein n=1 Tax=Polarella glacialis TaxID=89957 RepID=A0A813DL23_POLGL|nr:unnamed protein product [Polarella glacialis]
MAIAPPPSPSKSDKVKPFAQKINGQSWEEPEGEEPPAKVISSSPAPMVIPGGVFAFSDPDSIKNNVRQSLLKPDAYNVFDFYHESGFWQWFAKNPYFENTTLGVICLNAVYIAVDTDYNDATTLLEAHPAFQFMEHAFCAYFSFEWIVRFMAFKHKRNGLRDGWFVFDSILVAMMVVETWIMTIVEVIAGSAANMGPTAMLRLFRLLRLSRLMRMLRSLPELMILVKGMVTAMKSVVYVMGLLVMITYVFAIALTQLTGGLEVHDLYFKSVIISMYSLLIYATFLDNLADFCDAIREESLPCLLIVFVYVGLAAMTVMNMLTGVLCEVVSAVAATENEERMTVAVSETLKGMLNDMDSDNNGLISHKEFNAILQNKAALTALEQIGVDPVGCVDFADLFFVKDNKFIELTFPEFMIKLIELRESNSARVKDIVNLWKQMNPKLGDVSKDLGELKDRTRGIERAVVKLIKTFEAVAGQELPSNILPESQRAAWPVAEPDL